MSVLIKGITLEQFYRDLNNVRDMDVGWNAVQLPPHGRLIDADALDDAFTDLRWENGDYKSGALLHWGDRPNWCLKGSEIESLINAAPTIIEAEEGE